MVQGKLRALGAAVVALFILSCAPPPGAFEAPVSVAWLDELQARAARDARAAAELGWALWLDRNDTVAARDWLREGAASSEFALLGAAEVAWYGGWLDEAARRYAVWLHHGAVELARLAVHRLWALSHDSTLATRLLWDVAVAEPEPQAGEVALSIDRLRPELGWRVNGQPSPPRWAVVEWRVAGPLDGARWLGIDDRPPQLRLGIESFLDVTCPLGRLVPHPHHTGLYFAESNWTAAADGPHRIGLHTPAAARLYVDGALVVQRSPHQTAEPEVIEAVVPLQAGVHRVELVLATASPADSAMVQVRPESAEIPSTFEGPPVLKAWVSAQLDLAAGDWTAARAALDTVRLRAPHWSPLHWAEAELAAGEPWTPHAKQANRRRARLRDALEQDGGAMPAALAAAQDALSQGEAAQAAEILSDTERILGSRGIVSVGLLAAKGELWLRSGLDIDAERAFEEALAIHPGHCRALEALADRAWNRPTLDAILSEREARLQGCPRTRTWAIGAARRRGDLAGALSRLQTARALDDTNESLFRLEQDVLAALGKTDEAMRALQERERRFGSDGEYALRRADAQARSQGIAGFRQALVRSPAQARSADVFRKVEMVTANPVWRVLVERSEQAAEQMAAQHAGEGTEVLLQDEAIVFGMLGPATRLRFVRTLIRLGSETAVEAAGEVSVPVGAEILWLRTIKPIGMVIEPEEFAQKESLSLTEVEVGDLFDLALLFFDDLPQHASGFAVHSVLFGAHGERVRRARLSLAFSPDTRVKWEVRQDDRGVIQVLPWKPGTGLEGIDFVADDLVATPPEPGSPWGFGALPHVQVWSMSWPELGRNWQDALNRSERLPPSMVERLNRLSKDHPDASSLARAVYTMVRDRISEEGAERGPGVALARPVDQTWTERRGPRAPLLLAALRASGFTAHLVLASPWAQDLPYPDVPPAPDAWPHLLVAVQMPGGAEVWLDVTGGDLPYGYISPTAQGRPAQRLQAGVLAGARVPSLPIELDRRIVQVQLRMEADGTLIGTWRDELNGALAYSYRQYLLASTEQEQRQALSRLVERTLPGGRVVAHTAHELRNPEAPLCLELEVVATPPMSAQGAVSLALRPLPEELATNYAGLAQRREPLLPDLHQQLDVQISVELGSAWRVDNSPAPAQRDSKHGQYTRRVSVREGGIDIHKSFTWRLHMIDPDEYAGFAILAAEMEQADTVLLQVRPAR